MCDKKTRDERDAAARVAAHKAMMDTARATASSMVGEEVSLLQLSRQVTGSENLIFFTIKTKSAKGLVREVKFFAQADDKCIDKESTAAVSLDTGLVVSDFAVSDGGIKVEFENLDGYKVKSATIFIAINLVVGLTPLISFSCKTGPEES